MALTFPGEKLPLGKRVTRVAMFLFVVCTCILCLLPYLTRCSFTDVLSSTPTGVSEINHLT